MIPNDDVVDADEEELRDFAIGGRRERKSLRAFERVLRYHGWVIGTLSVLLVVLAVVWVFTIALFMAWRTRDAAGSSCRPYTCENTAADFKSSVSVPLNLLVGSSEGDFFCTGYNCVSQQQQEGQQRSVTRSVYAGRSDLCPVPTPSADRL